MSRPSMPGYLASQNDSAVQADYRTPTTTSTIWAGGQQRPVVSEGEQRSLLATGGMIGAGVFAAGAIPFGRGRIWDKYVGAAQFVERVSPAQILSTFRISEALSPLETVAARQTKWGGQFWDDPSRQKYLEKLLGKKTFEQHKGEILSKGLVLDRGKLKIQGTQDVVLGRATKLRSYRELGQAEFFKNYVRAIGADDIKFSRSQQFLPIGGRNIAHAYSRFGYASMTEMTNRILRVSPTEIAELPIMRDMVGRIKERLGSKVTGSRAEKAFRTVFPELKAGAAHQTMGRYLTKRILPGIALWKGFQLADYMTGNMISGTVLGGYAQSKIMKAKLMEATGMQEYAERQEEIAPGSTGLLGLAAFPLKGAMLGFGAYGARLAMTAREAMKPGVGAAEAALRAAEMAKEKNYNTFFGLGKKLGFKQRNLSSALRRTGALLGAAFALPFLPGAIAGTETSEELAAIYSGEKEVAIRKGRYWEAGRSSYEGGRIQYFRKHAIPAYLSRGKIEALYGTEERKMELDPLLPWNWPSLLADPYQWEKEHYYEFPFPLIAPAFEDVPFIGPALAATIGQIVKPSKLMHCFSPEMPVRVDNGWKKIGSIVPGDIVVSHSGTKRKVKKIFLNKSNDEPAVELSTSSSLEPIKVTKGHKVLAIKMPSPCVRMRKRNGKIIKTGTSVDKHIANSLSYCMCEDIALEPKWYQIGDLQNGDYLIQRKEKYSDSRLDLCSLIDKDRWNIDGNNISRKTLNSYPKHIINSDVEDFDLGWLTGMYAAEGHARVKSGGNVSFALHIKEVKIANRIKKIIQKIIPDINVSIKDRSDHQCKVVTANSVLLRDILLAIHGENKDYELSPERFSSNFIKGYLLGVFEGDGYFDGPSNHVLTNIRHSIIKTTQRFFMSLGFVPKVYKAKNKDKQDCYFLHILKSEWNYIFNGDIIVYAIATEDFIDADFVYCKIKSMKDVKLSVTVDIEVEEDHSYLVDDFVVHNSEEWMRQQAEPGFGPAGFGPGISESGQISLPVGQMRGELEGYGYGPGQMEVVRLPRPFGERPAYELGEMPRGVPVDPYSPTQTFGEQAYRLTEMFGLPGYSLTVAKGMLTGTEEFYDQYERLESASRATGIERAYWDLQIGGGALSTELFRRLYPHRRRGIDLYNPIKNTMPGWLPGPGEPSPDFQHGFAYGKISEGELRLPGRGMQALYPELEGVDPKDYPLIWRYKVLADVAPYAPQTKFYKQMLQGLRKQDALSERDEELYQTIQDQQQQKKVFKEFRDQHKFIKTETEKRTVTISKMVSPGKFEIEEMPGVTIAMAGLKTSQAALSRMALTEHNELTQQEAGIRANQKRMRASQELRGLGVTVGAQVEIEISGDVLRQYAKTGSDRPEIRAVVRTGEGVNLNTMLLEAELAEYDKASAGVLEGQIAYTQFEQLAGTYWEAGIRLIDDPSEYLTPFSPFHKFLGTKTRTAVEEYAAAEAYGTSSAFWDRPWENFLRPMLHYAGYKYAGARDLPQHIKERNEIEEYFDKLKYIKATRLKNLALTQGDTEAAEEYEKMRRRTAFGADPYGNPLNGLLAMQKRDKPYYDAFVQASTQTERELIMDMLPKHERHLVRARWNIDMMNQLYAERKVKGSLSTEQHEMLEELHKRRISEGQAVDPAAMSEYRDYVDDVSEDAAVSYADFQREKVLESYFESHPLPRNDFVGFHPQVDLEDIKLVVVKNEGKDMHDFNLWESREKTLPYKPYIDEDAIAQVTSMENDMSSGDIQAVLYDILASYGVENVNITVDKILRKDPQNIIDLDITRDSLQVGFENAAREGWI